MDTIKGYPIIATWPSLARGAHRAGRLIVVDTARDHDERYVVAWQGWNASGTSGEWDSHWLQSVNCSTLAIAREMFLAFVQKEVV